MTQFEAYYVLDFKYYLHHPLVNYTSNLRLTLSSSSLSLWKFSLESIHPPILHNSP